MRRTLLLLAPCIAALAGNTTGQTFQGDWALVLPTGEAGWLAIRDGTNGPEAGLMWAVGSERPVKDFRIADGTLTFSRSARRPLAPKGEAPLTQHIRGWVQGDALRLVAEQAGGTPTPFNGRRMPPLPPPPDLGRISLGEPVQLLNGRDLTGWRVTDPAKKNGWSARDGVLRNDTPKTDFDAYGDHANLRTEAEFTDFQLSLEFRVPAPTGGNSGIYMCGRYEVQVTHRDSSMQGISGPGALFGRVAPTANAGRLAGEWETYVITFIDRHVTVVHNGRTVIDNQPVAGPTGGALDADVSRPGPLMLQGDHTSVEYRNIILRPAVRPVP